MFRQVGIGAAAVLSIGLLAAGCSEDGDTIVAGGGGSLLPGNTDQSPFAGFESNNLSPDGGAFSENGASVDQVLVKWNCDCPDSDGDSTNADNTALVLFTMNDNGTTNVNTKRALFASHYENGNFTPPVELLGDDRDQGVAIELDSYVLIPMNTASYQSGSTSTATEINTTRDNSGNWLIIGEYTTQFQTPGLTQTGATTLTSNNRGVRRTIASWVFQKSLRTSSLATNNLVGGVTQPFRYGFQELGTIVPTTFIAGGVDGAAVNGTSAANLDIPACHVTSYGAITDGFCGETCFDGEALPFTAESTPGVGDQDFDAFAASGTNALTTANRTAFTHAFPTLSRSGTKNSNSDIFARGNRSDLVQLGTAIYRPGEEVSHIVAVWTQVASSIAGGGSISSDQADTTLGGHELQLRYRTFNLASQTWEADEAEVPFAAERNARTTELRAGTQPFPILRGYNANLFFKYADASLIVSTGNNSGNLANQNQLALYPNSNGNTINDWSQDNTGGHAGGNLTQTAAGNVNAFWREIIGVVRFQDDGDGTSSLAGASLDVSSTAETQASVGVHATTTITVNNTARDTQPSREIANFNCCDDDFVNRSIIGADEGMSDLSIFYVMADNTRTGTGATLNMDRELWVTALNPTGALATTSFAAGTNPSRVSGTGEADYHVSTAPNDGNVAAGADGRILQDPVLIRNNGSTFSENGNAGGLDEATSGTNYNASGAGPCYFELTLNRTGSYAGILFSKDSGNSSRANSGTGFTQSLYATVYQPFRPAVSTTGGTTTSTAANLESRLPSAGPTRVDSDTGFGITQRDLNNADPADDAEESRAWRALPVNAYRWQGFLGYKTGFQSDINIMTIFWEQSDSTEDRVLVRRMTVTPGTGNPLSAPTFALGTAIEIDSTASVPSFAQYGDDTTSRDTFTFLDTTARIWTNFKICDAGASSSGTSGDTFVVYSKVSDNTISDGDGAEQEIRAILVTSSAAASQVIDSMVNENAPAVLEGGATLIRNSAGSQATRTDRYQINFVHSGTVVASIVPVPCDTDTSTNGGASPTLTDQFGIAIYMLEPESVRSTNGTGTTTITGNFTNRGLLETRFYDGSDNGNNTTLESRLTPSVAPATFEAPIQIDHEQGVADDTKAPVICKNGRTIGLIFETNAQLWYQSTSDGTTYNKDAQTGLSNPLLITNQSSQDVTAWAASCCLDSNGDAQGVILWFRKQDVDDDDRLFIGAGSVQ